MSNNEDRTNMSTQQQLEDINNQLERVRSDTHNINRILTLTNKDNIIGEIRRAVGRSEIRAAILLLAKDYIAARELARQLGVSSENLAMYLKPLLLRGYVTVRKKGTQRFYIRSELVELVEFESIPEFEKLLKSWKENLTEETPVQATSPTNEQAVVAESTVNES